jgi:hypothetical protein
MILARIGQERKAYRFLVGKLEGKRPLGRPRCRWEDRLTMDLWRLAGGVSGFIWLKIGPVAGSCKYGDKPSGSASRI